MLLLASEATIKVLFIIVISGILTPKVAVEKGPSWMPIDAVDCPFPVSTCSVLEGM